MAHTNHVAAMLAATAPAFDLTDAPALAQPPAAPVVSRLTGFTSRPGAPRKAAPKAPRASAKAIAQLAKGDW